ncbi:MAG: hypothetical protein HY911_02880 [Desulfobacterales bacterium]|nr:hypothetical protein [Desulfobacterales bacterium]
MSAPFQHQFPREEFDYQALLDALKAYARPRDKISDLLRKGVVIRVKKGLYILGENYRRRPYSRELLANLIHGPSYISMDFALQYYGMIPERVEAVTSVTTGRSKRFMTPLGLFVYRNLPLPLFQIGMTRIEIDANTAFLMATPEKALCDKIRDDRGVAWRGLKDVRHHLIENLRMEEKALADLNLDHIADIARRCASGKLRRLHAFIAQLKR